MLLQLDDFELVAARFNGSGVASVVVSEGVVTSSEVVVAAICASTFGAVIIFPHTTVFRELNTEVTVEGIRSARAQTRARNTFPTFFTVLKQDELLIGLFKLRALFRSTEFVDVQSIHFLYEV